jgi:hypothetical protein
VCAVGVQEAKDIDKWEKLLVAGMGTSQQGRFHHIQSVRLDPVSALPLSKWEKHICRPSAKAPTPLGRPCSAPAHWSSGLETSS